MQVVLVMFRGDERRSFSLTRDMTIIGRREDCDFRIPLGEISRKHCRLIKNDDGTLQAEDLGSSNGTYVNGTRVQEAALQPGDTLQVGSIVFVVQIDGSPADSDLAPVSAGAKTTMAPGSEARDAAVEEPADIHVADAEEDVDLEESGAVSAQEITIDETPEESSAGRRVMAEGEPEGLSNDGEEFDPMAVLGSADDSGMAPGVTDSQIHEDIMIDLHGSKAG